MRANSDQSAFPFVAFAFVGVALLASCVEIKDASDQKATADSAAGALAKPPVQPAPTAKSTANFGPDSITRVRGGPLFTPEAVIALQTDTAHSVTEIDTAAATAIPESEIAELKRELMIPVRGVPASALYDTYEEKRGGGTRPHEALDIPAPRGTPVLSATSGRVLKLFDSKAGGKMVYAADSTEHFILMYAHLDSYANGLAEGQPLHRGQVLGAVGTTGNAPPNLPHLHFAIARSTDVKQWWKGAPVNPYPLLMP
jgi:murein DD-endopeptidase MepM/ murein hydrolase activator NlpD